MFTTTTTKVALFHVCFLFAFSTTLGRPHTQRLGQQKWLKSYVKLAGQTWFSIYYGKQETAIYTSGRVKYSYDSDIPCLGSKANLTYIGNQTDHFNGVVCGLHSRDGLRKWCARTCEESIPVLSTVVAGKEHVYTSGITDSMDSILYTIEKESGKQRMRMRIQGRISKMDHNRDGVYACGSATNKGGKTGMFIARATTGGLKWHKIITEVGLKTCLGISAPKYSFSAYVIGIMIGNSNERSLCVMKMERETGEIEWKTQLSGAHLIPISGDITAEEGVLVTSLNTDTKSKQTQVWIHKLGDRTGLELWSKQGKNADGLHRSSLASKHQFIYASYNSSGVYVSALASSSTASLLGQAEDEQHVWVQRQNGIMSKATDTAFGRNEAAILWGSNDGHSLVQLEAFNHVRKMEHGNVITRIKLKLNFNVPTDKVSLVKSGICDIMTDVMRGKAQIVNSFLIVCGMVTKSEAEVVIKKTFEDRDNEGRSYVESSLGLSKRTVRIEGRLMTVEARNMQDQKHNQAHKSVTLSGQEGNGEENSVTAQSSTSSSGWTWWKVVMVTIGGVGLIGGVWLAARRL